MTAPRGSNGKFTTPEAIKPGGAPETTPAIPPGGATVETNPSIANTPLPAGGPIGSDNRPEPMPEKRGRGRPRGSGTARPRAMNPNPPGTPEAPPEADLSKATAYRQMGIMAAGLFVGGTVGVFGEEWKPKSAEELNGLEIAVEAYCRAKGIGELSPGWVLVGVVAAYALPRLSQPATAEKLERWSAKLRPRSAGGAQSPAPGADALPVDTGNRVRDVPQTSSKIHG